MVTIAVYDACVLYPAALRDFLLRLAEVELVQPRWSALILDECFRSILRERPDLTEAALGRTRSAMGGGSRPRLRRAPESARQPLPTSGLQAGAAAPPCQPRAP